MRDITVSFLGTTSGGGPSDTRNCSSLVLDGLGNGSLWMFDCAEGTVRQFAMQPNTYSDSRHLRMSKITKIFITHMHADHTMGIITILRNVLGFYKEPTGEAAERIQEAVLPKVEIYGPRGIRKFVRTIMTLTHTRSADKYVVHELLSPDETASVSSISTENNPLHGNELPGKDLSCDANGFWRNIASEVCIGYGSGRYRMLVDAGPILHRDPCIGYIVREVISPSRNEYEPSGPMPEGRNIVILGDTHDPSALIPLINSPPAVEYDASAEGPEGDHYLPRVSLLVHEATDAFIPPNIDPHGKTGRKRNAEIVLEKMLDKGHSTPGMAGAFAKRIDAERLVLNHIGARFPAPAPGRHQGNFERFRVACIQEIERQAEETWCRGKVIAAHDFYSIRIPPYNPIGVPDPSSVAGAMMPWRHEGEKPSYQKHESRRNDPWVPGPGYREQPSASASVAVHTHREHHSEVPVRQGSVYPSLGNPSHKRENSGNGNHGRGGHHGRGTHSRGGRRGGYSNKRPRNA